METLGTKYLQGIPKTNRTDTLWKMYQYQITGFEEIYAKASDVGSDILHWLSALPSRRKPDC